MVSPRRRISQAALTLFLVLVWIVSLAFAPTGVLQADPKAVLIVSTPPLCANLALVLLLTSNWKANLNARHRRKNSPELEIIPMVRGKSLLLEPRKIRGPVVVVHRRHIRAVQRPSVYHQKRLALGLPERATSDLNRRRAAAWHRRISGSTGHSPRRQA